MASYVLAMTKVTYGLTIQHKGTIYIQKMAMYVDTYQSLDWCIRYCGLFSTSSFCIELLFLWIFARYMYDVVIRNAWFIHVTHTRIPYCIQPFSSIVIRILHESLHMYQRGSDYCLFFLFYFILFFYILYRYPSSLLFAPMCYLIVFLIVVVC